MELEFCGFCVGRARVVGFPAGGFYAILGPMSATQSTLVRYSPIPRSCKQWHIQKPSNSPQKARVACKSQTQNSLRSALQLLLEINPD